MFLCSPTLEHGTVRCTQVVLFPSLTVHAMSLVEGVPFDETPFLPLLFQLRFVIELFALPLICLIPPVDGLFQSLHLYFQLTSLP